MSDTITLTVDEARQLFLELEAVTYIAAYAAGQLRYHARSRGLPGWEDGPADLTAATSVVTQAAHDLYCRLGFDAPSYDDWPRDPETARRVAVDAAARARERRADRAELRAVPA